MRWHDAMDYDKCLLIGTMMGTFMHVVQILLEPA
jgi:hypothetical protein